MAARTGIITGTGLYTLPGLDPVEQRVLSTPYGEVTVEIGALRDREVAFPRHGKGHTIAPRDINYRANLFAFHLLGVEWVLATSVSGSLVPHWGPGTLVLIDQFLNFSTGRADSFYPLDGKLAHVDVTEPYCPTLHQHLYDAGQALGVPLEQGGTYACFDGPRFETRAEIEMVRRMGGDLVGQTNYPECVLARELAICYATIGVVSNHAAGMQSKLTVEEVLANLQNIGEQVGQLFVRVILALEAQEQPYDCTCRHALDSAFV
jgi:5'-methylthioadenosine phosphorylase